MSKFDQLFERYVVVKEEDMGQPQPAAGPAPEISAMPGAVSPPGAAPGGLDMGGGQPSPTTS